MQKVDRLKRSLPALVVVCMVVLGGATLLTLDYRSPGRIDSKAAERIRASCGTRVPCELRLGDLVGGPWDRFYEFSPAAPQTTVDQVLGTHEVHIAPLQRILVLMKDGEVERRQYAHSGQGQPLPNEIVFAEISAGAHPGWVGYKPDALFTVKPCATLEGLGARNEYGKPYYLLTPAGIPPVSSFLCR